jgi:pimeloyl-ACP methyl ester carboxylesterase
MASDVVAVMNFLAIKKAALVGWSDGGILGLQIAIHHSGRLSKLFAFAANTDPMAVNDVSGSQAFKAYFARTKGEYEQFSPTPAGYDSLLAEITGMSQTQPNITADDLSSIKKPTWIVDGNHDEAIKREDTLFMAYHIHDSGLLIEPQVSHFAFLQDPKQFNRDVLHFLMHVKTK